MDRLSAHYHRSRPRPVFDEDGYRVSAYPLSHPVECYGYRIEQHDKPGTLDAAQLIADGVRPGPLFHQLKLGQRVELEDGRVIDGSRYLGPSTPGKTLAILAIPPLPAGAGDGARRGCDSPRNHA